MIYMADQRCQRLNFSIHFSLISQSSKLAGRAKKEPPEQVVLFWYKGDFNHVRAAPAGWAFTSANR